MRSEASTAARTAMMCTMPRPYLRSSRGGRMLSAMVGRSTARRCAHSRLVHLTDH
jgi:hypothetical protein